MKQCCIVDLEEKTKIDDGIFKMDFHWEGDSPRAGQFFLVRASPSSAFLARPLSVLDFDDRTRKVSFLVAVRGRGTRDIVDCKAAELTGPLGTGFSMVETPLPLALVAGGIGVAPLFAFAQELRRKESGRTFEFFAGFRERLIGIEQLLCENLGDVPLRITYEQAQATPPAPHLLAGRVTDVVDLSMYGAVYACGPEPLLKALKHSSQGAPILCFVSMERRMACGVGACLGCTVRTTAGNKRCCTDGPVFNTRAVLYD